MSVTTEEEDYYTRGEDFFQMKAPTDTSIIIYHAASGLFHKVRLSKLQEGSYLGRDVQAMELPLSMSFTVEIKIDWDSTIKGHFWERGGIWREVKLPIWVWRARVLRGIRSLYVVRKGCDLVVTGAAGAAVVEGGAGGAAAAEDDFVGGRADEC